MSVELLSMENNVKKNLKSSEEMSNRSACMVFLIFHVKECGCLNFKCFI